MLTETVTRTVIGATGRLNARENIALTLLCRAVRVNPHDAQAVQRVQDLHAGRTLRKIDAAGTERRASIRKHRRCGWLAEGSTNTNPPDAVGLFTPWSSRPPEGQKWTEEQAIEAALRHVA